MAQGGRPVDTYASPLLRARLRVPVVPEYYVRRERLLRLLDEAVNAPLTVVFAPAGVGKTVLLAGWAAESGAAIAWLSLDEADRDGPRLWSEAIAALETLAPGCGADARALLRRHGRLGDVVSQLLDDLEVADASRSVLVIDDGQFLEGDADVVESVALFLQHLPAWLHVVLLSRHEPPLPLDRLRARGQLGEARFAELKFSPPEAHEMLARLAPTLPDARIDAAAEHAAGWAAGLQLAGLAARSMQAQQQLEAQEPLSDLLVDDYVWRELLGAEEGELVDTLLDVAVVERVNVSLARALTGRDDADELLLRAEARGLFLSRRGPDGWFELHSLVRPALIGELKRRSPSRLAELHARAAGWLQEAREIPAALDHWIIANRPRDALQLLAAEGVALYDSGREETIRRTIDAIPADVATGDIQSMIDFTWCHRLVDRHRFEELVDHTIWWADRAGEPPTIRARLTMLQAMATLMGGRWVAGAEQAQHAMQEMGDGWWRDPQGRFGWNVIAREVALSERWDDSGDEIHEAEHALSRDPERRLAFEGTRALGDTLAGRPVDALRVAAGVRRAAEVSNMPILQAEIALAEAVAHRELGDHRRAVVELEALADRPAEAMLYCRVLATVELAQARLDDGDVESARTTFNRAESLVETEDFGADGRAWLARVGTAVSLAEADVDAAQRCTELVDDSFWRGVCGARVELARGNRTEATAALDSSVPRCPRHEVILQLLRARTSDHEVSTKHAAAAVEIATRTGMLQTVASEGPDAIELVERSAWAAPAEWLDRLRRVAADGRCQASVAWPDAVEALTERERDVLRFLASRLTVREIADELYVSVNTLKFHLKAIYRKLGVTSRAEAAAIARRTSVDRRTA